MVCGTSFAPWSARRWPRSSSPRALRRHTGAGPAVQAVDCIGLTVSDADRSADFYTRVLEFRRERETEVAGEGWEHLSGVFGMRARTVRVRLRAGLDLTRPGGGGRARAGHLSHVEVHPTAREILRFHRQGTLHGIRVDPEDGLLVAGDAGSQLTWMDAKVGDWVVTPRHGKPVEVNALHYNALRLAAGWARAAGDAVGAAEVDREAARVARSFVDRFWDPDRERLFDVVRPDGLDARIGPTSSSP